jgi:hypothetical protein
MALLSVPLDSYAARTDRGDELATSIVSHQVTRHDSTSAAPSPTWADHVPGELDDTVAITHHRRVLQEGVRAAVSSPTATRP